MASLYEKVLQRLLEDATQPRDVIVPRHHIRQLLHPGLAVVHLASKLRYTVVDHGDGKVKLETPNKDRHFEVDMQKFEQDYAVD